MKNILLSLIAGYVFINMYLYFAQKSMVYFPDKTDFKKCHSFEENEIKEYNGTRFYEKIGKGKNLIVFFHGNAGSACGRSHIKSLLQKTESSFIFVEYSGFSDTTTSPNINDILKDVDNIGEYIKNENYDRVYAFGRSLGTGPASYFASRNVVEKLLLISPYSQLYKVAADKYPFFPVKYMFSEDYNSEKYLEDYDNSVLIIHGKEDNVIPIKFGKQLFDSLETKDKEIIELDNTTHHNIFNYKGINEKIIEYLK